MVRLAGAARTRRETQRRLHKCTRHANLLAGTAAATAGWSSVPRRPQQKHHPHRHAERPHRTDADRRQHPGPGNAPLHCADQQERRLDGYHIDAPETDTQYQVPPAVEEYEHAKQIECRSPSCCTARRRPRRWPRGWTATTSPARVPASVPPPRRTARASPTCSRFAANYWSQGAAACTYVSSSFGGSLHGKKIAFVLRQPRGARATARLLHKLKEMEGFELAVRRAAARHRRERTGAGNRPPGPGRTS